MSEAILFTGGFWIHQDIDVDCPIYRIIKKEYLYSNLKERRFYFRKIIRWDDPWEIPVRYCNVTEEKFPALKMTNALNLLDDLFGTCWTTTVESDALWRIYSGKEKDGICVETTPRKLLESIDFCFKPKGFVDGFIGPVMYCDMDTVSEETFYNNKTECYPRNMIPAFIKRSAFEHEREQRFVIHYTSHTNIFNGNYLSADKNGLWIPFKNLDFINRLIIDPRLSSYQEQETRDIFKKYKLNIEKSDLYKIPEKKYDILFSGGVETTKHLVNAKYWVIDKNEFLTPIKKK